MTTDTGMTGGSRLSSGQERLWLLQHLNPADAGYNLVLALEFTPEVVESALQTALDAAVTHHEVLRSVFVADALAAPYHTVVDRFRVPLVHLVRTADEEPQSVARDLLAQPFELADAPPLRAVLVRCADRPDVVYLVLHHILVDARSLDILTRDVMTLYEAHRAGQPVVLPAAPARFADFVALQRRPDQATRVAADVEYWRAELDGVELLRLPTDRPRTSSTDRTGDRVGFALSPAETSALQRFALRQRCALPSLVAAAFQVVLSTQAGQSDITIGTVFTGRGDAAFNNVVGFFVNTCALRTDLTGASTGRELLRLVHARLAAAHDHQDAPFTQVVATTQAARELDHNPLFDVVYVHHPDQFPADETAPGEGGVRRLPAWDVAVRFDLELTTVVDGGALQGSLAFRTALFERSTIALMADRLAQVIRRLMNDPDAPVANLDRPTPAECGLLDDWNRTGAQRPPATLPALFEAQVTRTPTAVALDAGGAEWTYQALDAAADRLARFLAGRGLGPEDLVAVALPRSADLVIAVLGIMKAGAAYLPIDVTYPQQRVELMLRDAQARCGITTSDMAPKLPGPEWFALDVARSVAPADPGEADRATDADRKERLHPENLAYVIFTSGSTGRPKGVAVTHAGLAGMALTQAEHLGSGPPGRVLQQASPSFDAAIWELVQALASGATLVLPDPDLVLAGRPLADVLTGHRITHATLTPTALGSLPMAPRTTTDLRTLVVAGEACPPDLVDAWSPGRRMLNAYGPTETTVCATVSDPLSPGSGAPIGRPVHGTQIHVLDTRLRLAPVGAVGEVYIAGAGLARGYLGPMSLTAQRFVANPYGPAGSRMYRTGDLARWRTDGTLDYLGRSDDQVKIRGFRVEPAEVESVLAELPTVAAVAVLARDDGRDDRRLVAYVVPGRPDAVRPDEIRAFASRRLPGYLVPGAFVLLDALPLTASGKLDRQALPAPTYVLTGTRRAPRSPREQALCEVFGEVLGVAPPGIDDGFFELGGHSLLAIRLRARIRSTLGVEVPIRAVFEAPTVAQLALRLDAGHTVRPPLRRMVRPPRPPLSPGQRRLWFLSQLEETAAYNVAFALRLHGEIDIDVLGVALTDVVDRHEILRTVYPETAGEPWQDVRPTRECPPLDVVRSTEADVRRELAAAARQTFDLRVDIPLRARLFAVGADDHVLLIIAHHIAFDGWSAGPFRRDLAKAYDARRTGRECRWPPLPVQYVDYTLWQRHLLGDGSHPASLAAHQLKYWTSHLAGAPQQIVLPFDRQRSVAADGAGAELAFDLPARLHADLRTVARDHQVTLFMVLHAALAAVLGRLGAGSDIVLGTPIAERTDDELDGLVGFFVNTLALRTDLSGDPTFGELLARVRGTDLVAYAHPDLPFETVVEALHPRRVQGVNPVFQVSLALQEAAEPEVSFAGIRAESMMIGTGGAKFDLSVVFSEAPGSATPLSGLVEYRTDLFDAATIEGMVARLTQFLEAVTESPGKPITRIDLLTPVERRRFAQRDTVEAGSIDRPLPELLRRQVGRTPDGRAVSCGTATLTYRELDVHATRMAAELSARGVRLESPVVVAMERSIDLVIALVAIMKAGGHYVPLPTSLPAARVCAVLRDSGASVLLVDPPTATSELLRCAADGGLVVMDATAPAAGPPTGGDAFRVAPARHPENLAYVMYTSGSTGVPKGVAVTDRDVAALAADRCWGIGPGDRVLFHAPHAFDASVYELWIPLLTGGEVVVAPPGELDLFAIRGLISAQAVTTVHVTAGLFRIMAEECPDAFAGVREVLTGGDVVSPAAVRRLLHAVPGLRVRHLYGPTETTLCVTQHPVQMDEEPEHWIPLGRPLDGARLYVLDSRLQLTPPGVDGELYIGGAGLARGYLNRPGLTAERFVADPFGPAGSLMYRTGDLVRWTADGRLRFIGRGDTQVKVNGFRVEIGEIESVLASRPDVAQAAVLARDDGRGAKRLFAYVVPVPGHEVDAAELRRFAGASLPSYMIPAAFTFLDSLPLTPNAKINWRTLPELELAPAGGSRGPRTLREQVLCRLFGEVLELPSVGVDVSFFDLGGHSLLAMKLISRIRTELQTDMSIRMLFEAPTVAALALSLDADPADPFHMILPLRAGGTGTPVFFIHPIGGLSWCYSRFLPYIPREHPVYGLQSSGYLGRSDRPGSVEEIITEYVRRIRELHPRGPYALAGWSFGGFMAHEIAVELLKHGADVPLVVVLDAAPTRRHAQADAVTSPEDVAQRIAVLVHGAAAGMAESLTGVLIADLAEVAGHFIRLAAEYDSRVFDGQLLSIEASGSADARAASGARWAQYARGGVITHVVDCAHDQLMDPEIVRQTGTVLAEAIRQRLRPHVPRRPGSPAECR